MITFDFDSKDIYNIHAEVELEIVAKAVKKDIEQNLQKARSYDGSKIAPLKKSYAKTKYNKLRHTRIFDGFRKGKDKLINSVMMKKITDNHYQIFISDRNGNDEIMKYLQEGKSPLAGERRAFGIGKEGVQRIAALIERATIIKNGK
jgi:hypothetical protein